LSEEKKKTNKPNDTKKREPERPRTEEHSAHRKTKPQKGHHNAIPKRKRQLSPKTLLYTPNTFLQTDITQSVFNENLTRFDRDHQESTGNNAQASQEGIADHKARTTRRNRPKHKKAKARKKEIHGKGKNNGRPHHREKEKLTGIVT